MRPRATGISAAVARPQQLPTQTFKPKSEWKHEQEASFLSVFLPGFVMDQLTITPDNSKRTVNIEGKRRLPNNRLLSVNETFNVPEDCELPEMDKQFGRGTLTLKIPRIIVIAQPQQTAKEAKEEASMAQEPVGGGVGDSVAAAKDEEQPDAAAMEGTSTTTGFGKAAAMDEKSAVTADKGDDQQQKLVEKKEDQINDGGGKQPVGKGKADESHENLVVKNGGVKQEETKEQSMESAPTMADVAKAEEKEKEKEKNNPKSTSDEYCADAKGKEEGVKASSKKGMVKEEMNSNEDRKLIVNMGAAALIILGIGVTLFYTIAHKLGLSK